MSLSTSEVEETRDCGKGSLKCFLYGVLHLISKDIHVEMDVIEEEINRENIATYLSSKFSDNFGLSNDRLSEINKLYHDMRGTYDGKYNIEGDKSGLDLIVALGINAL